MGGLNPQLPLDIRQWFRVTADNALLYIQIYIDVDIATSQNA